MEPTKTATTEDDLDQPTQTGTTEDDLDQPTQTETTEDDPDLLRLKQLCFPPWHYRINSHAGRSERSEYAKLLQLPLNEKWDRVLQRLRKVFFQIAPTLDRVFVWSRNRCTWVWPELAFSSVIEPVAAILYDQECSGDQSLESITYLDVPNNGRIGLFDKYLYDAVSNLFEQMLLVDYGIGVFPIGKPRRPSRDIYFEYVWPRVFKLCQYFVYFAAHCKNGNFPSWAGWHYLSLRFSDFMRWGNIADYGLMLYYYYTHRKSVGYTAHTRGMTGYTGILQELIDEVPIRGPDRLVRKLSTDVNDLIPRFVKDSGRRQRMIATAKDIAAQQGWTIHTPVTHVPTPESDPRFVDGASSHEHNTLPRLNAYTTTFDLHSFHGGLSGTNRKKTNREKASQEKTDKERTDKGKTSKERTDKDRISEGKTKID